MDGVPSKATKQSQIDCRQLNSIIILASVSLYENVEIRSFSRVFAYVSFVSYIERVQLTYLTRAYTHGKTC